MASTEKLPSGKYRGVYRDAAGKKQHTPTRDRKQDAREDAVDAEAKAKRIAAAKAGTLSAKTTWCQWWEVVNADRPHESDNGVTEKYIVRSYLLPKWGDVALNLITRRDVQNWVNALERGTAPIDMVSERHQRRPLSASYVQRIWSPFSVSITRALEEGVLDASPCAGVKLPKRQKKPKPFVAVDEVDKLITDDVPEVYADAIRFAHETGLRPGELTGLHCHRVDLTARVMTVAEVWVHRAKKIRGWPKDKDAREVPLSATAVAILRRRLAGRELRQPCGIEHMRGERCGHQLVFLAEDGQPLNRYILRWWMRRGAIAAEVPMKSGYALRRGYATRLAEGGLDPYALAEVMGHGDINLSREYVQQTTTARARVLAALGERPALAAVEDRGTRGTGDGTDRGNQSLPGAPAADGSSAS